MNDIVRVGSQSVSPEASDPVAAFSALTGEVALLRRATEGLSAEKARLDMPDYSLTLGAMDKRLAAMAQTLEDMAEMPALQWTPEEIARGVERAAEQSRRSDAKTIREARDGHREATAAIQSLVGFMRSRQQQCRNIWQAAACGVAAGCVLWSILPGVLLRSLPASWHMPESMAAHIIGEPSLWEAGGRLMHAGDPGSWRSTIIAVEMRRDNRDAIDTCEKRATKAGKPVNCTIRIRARPVDDFTS